MTQLATQRSAIQAKAHPTVYTVLIIVAIIALAITIGIVLNNLMSPVEKNGYGIGFSDVFNPVPKSAPVSK